MKKLIHILLFIAGTVNAAPHLTRNYAYRYFTTRDGLAQMQVLSAFQDRDGFMWFGTKGGVSRFDGISFKNITQEDGIPVGEMISIGEWGYEKLFFFHNNFQILHENGSLELIQLPETLEFLNHIFQSIEIGENEILLVNLKNPNNKLVNQNILRHFIWNKNTRKFRQWKAIDYKILAYNKKYILTSNALYLRSGLSVKKLQSFPNKYDEAQVNWQRGDIFLHNSKEFTIEKYKLNNNHLVFSKTILRNIVQSRFTLLPDNSILYFSDQSVAHLYPPHEASFGMEMAYLEKPYVDREGNLWITSNNGLYNFFNLNFEEYTFGLAKPDNIWSVLEDNQHNMYFGSYGWGLWRMNKYGKLNAVNQSGSNWKLQYMGSTRSKSGMLFMPKCSGLTVFKNNKFIDIKTGLSLSAYFDEAKKQIYYSGLDTITLKRGLWIGIDEKRKFIPWSKGFPIGLGKDSKGKIRLGSFHGQGYLLGNRIITDTTIRPYEGVISFAIDKWGRLWKATTKGYYVELPNGKEYRFAPQIKGLVASIWNYRDKYLVMGTNTGMAIAPMSANMIQQPEVLEIGYETGFTGLDTGQNAFFEDHNGDMWVCTSLNVLKLNPDRLMQSRIHFLPPIRVASISYSVNNNDWSSEYFSDKQEIKISSGNKFFRIDYVANSISAPKSLRFKYRLIGLSEKWSEPVYTKSVNYTNIGYGKYRFEVQCSFDDINWSSIAQSPAIEITAPIYLTPFAFIIYLLSIIAISIYITKVYTKRKHAKQLQEMSRQKLENELQLNTLRSKVIPHFTKNVLSAIGHFAMTDKLKAGHYISVFSKFTGLTLANADKNYIALSDELEYIEKYLELEKMRFGDNFEYKISIDNDVSLQILIPSMTLHTYCDNAIRHGLVNKIGTGLLIVEIQNKPDGVTLTIIDNGIGRKRATELGTQGNGQGLKLIQAQMDFYNQKNRMKMTHEIIDLEDINGNSLGTRIELFVPNGYLFL